MDAVRLGKKSREFRTAALVVAAVALAGCAGESLSTGGATATAPDVAMAGRWKLSAPNAPVCGMNFAGEPGKREGAVVPEGGCPGQFFMSRTWTIEPGALTINDRENMPLARLTYSGGRFEGTSTEGLPVTLAR